MNSAKKITCVVVDDEPLALELMKQYINAVSSLQLVTACNNAMEALQVLQTQSIDLLLLDIQMPRILGTDFVRALKHAPKVIFTTAHRKYAVEGYELDAIDFLLKPISFDRFLKAVNKIFLVPPDAAPAPPQIVGNSIKLGRNDFISFRVNRKNIQIALEEILYIESLKDYVKVVTKTKHIITKLSIVHIENILPAERFIRIHRSYIVALNKIETYTNEMVEIAKKELPISRMYRYEVRKVLLPN